MKRKTALSVISFFVAVIATGVIISILLLKSSDGKTEARKTTTKSNIVIKSEPITSTKTTTPAKTTTTAKPAATTTQKTTTAPTVTKPAPAPKPVTPAPAATVEKEPASATEFYERGVRLYYSGKYDDALNDFNKAIKMNPNYAEAYCELGVTTMEKGDFKTAINYLQKSIQLKPDYPKSNYAIAVCYARMTPADTVNARKYLEAAKKLGYLVPPWFEDFLKKLEEKKTQ